MYLLLSLVVGVAQPGFSGTVPWPTYVHLLVLGWLTQLIFGVAHWMFPRPRAMASPWSTRLGWMTYAGLNLGLVLRALAESSPAAGWQRPGFVTAAVLQLVAGWAFVVMIWPRLRER